MPTVVIIIVSIDYNDFEYVQLSAIQGVENHSSRAHSLPDKSESVAGLTKLNDLYRTANEVGMQVATVLMQNCPILCC